jgi:hypothetical protein
MAAYLLYFFVESKSKQADSAACSCRSLIIVDRSTPLMRFLCRRECGIQRAH